MLRQDERSISLTLSFPLQGSRLGTHTSGSIPPQSSFAGVEGGLAVLPQGALSQPRSRDEFKSLGE